MTYEQAIQDYANKFKERFLELKGNKELTNTEYYNLLGYVYNDISVGVTSTMKKSALESIKDESENKETLIYFLNKL